MTVFLEESGFGDVILRSHLMSDVLDSQPRYRRDVDVTDRKGVSSRTRQKFPESGSRISDK